MSNEPEAPTEETPHLTKEHTFTAAQMGAYSEILLGEWCRQHSIFSFYDRIATSINDVIRLPYSPHLSRQEILEAEQETAIKPDQILIRKWPDLWSLPVYEVTEMELEDCE